MHEKIIELTKEQEEQIPTYIKKWRDFAGAPSSTNEKAQDALNAWCDHAKIKRPNRIIMLDNPRLMYEQEYDMSVVNPPTYSMWHSMTLSILPALSKPVSALLSDSLIKYLDNSINNEVRTSTDSLSRSILNQEESMSMSMSMIKHHVLWSPYPRIALLDYAKNVMGANMCEDTFLLYENICKNLPAILPCEETCFILKKVHSIHWDADDVLHNTEGPSAKWEGYKLWNIHGVTVDEQIVMEPHTQTLYQIQTETNTDRRAIRIERYGWPRYLSETKAEKIDSRTNPIDNTKECLMALKNGTKRLVVSCPTGRVFAMGIPIHVTTCIEAQKFLSPRRFKSLGRT